MKESKILGMLGLAARARKIAFGADSVESEIIKKKSKLIVIAKDASDRTKEKFQKLTNENSIELIEICTIDEISKKIGKSNKAVISIYDTNIANQIKKINGGVDIG